MIPDEDGKVSGYMMSVFKRTVGGLVLTLVALASLGHVATPSYALERRPIAAVTIYPGEIIREQMLSDADVPSAAASSAFATSHSMLVGKVAKHTLLPGAPIPSNAIGELKIVKIGALVRLIYEEGGLQIVTYATALQAGAAGDFISVRNQESGVTIGGVIQTDGSIHVGPG